VSAPRLAVLLAGLGLAALAYRVQVDDLHSTPGRALAAVSVGLAFLVAGLAARTRQPANRLGTLMVLAGFALLARQLRYSHDAATFTVFFALGELGYALVPHVALAYPSGRVRDRFERAFLVVAYVSALAFPLAMLLFYDGTRPLRWFDPTSRESLLLVSSNAELVSLLQKTYAVVVYGVLASIFVFLIARKLVRATPRGRRLLTPLLLAAVVSALRAVFDSVLTFWQPPPAFVLDNLYWWQIVGLVAVPLALLAGLLTSRLAHASVGDLVLRLEHAPPQTIRDELARALDDPSLEVALWLPDRGAYADPLGRRVDLPQDGADRVVTKIAQDGHPLAALVHDPTLRDEPELVEAAAAAARLSLENARLHAEVHAQLDKVKESRARIVEAADDERRRIERDLHDGAQQRLVALALELRSAQHQLGGAGDPGVEQLLSAAVSELQTAVAELRELARGIHPAVLTESGLAAALESLATRSPLPVGVEIDIDPRAPANVEATAYFVACEALANVVKHAAATEATIRASRRDERLVLEVEDDGVGGAVLNGGTGLRGLADRVEAHGGTLRIDSPLGSGTRVTGEIPCGS
jgi:signal transduction histidine kinase